MSSILINSSYTPTVSISTKRGSINQSTTSHQYSNSNDYNNTYHNNGGNNAHLSSNQNHANSSSGNYGHSHSNSLVSPLSSYKSLSNTTTNGIINSHATNKQDIKLNTLYRAQTINFDKTRSITPLSMNNSISSTSTSSLNQVNSNNSLNSISNKNSSRSRIPSNPQLFNSNISNNLINNSNSYNHLNHGNNGQYSNSTNINSSNMNSESLSPNTAASLSPKNLLKTPIKPDNFIKFEELAKFITTCTNSVLDLYKLKQLLSELPINDELNIPFVKPHSGEKVEVIDINEVIYISDKRGVGLYSELVFNTINYSIREGGSPATLVHYAAIRGSVEVLEILLQYDVNPKILVADNRGALVSPSQIALTNGHYAFCKVLDRNRSSTSTCSIQ